MRKGRAKLMGTKIEQFNNRPLRESVAKRLVYAYAYSRRLFLFHYRSKRALRFLFSNESVNSSVRCASITRAGSFSNVFQFSESSHVDLTLETLYHYSYYSKLGYLYLFWINKWFLCKTLVIGIYLNEFLISQPVKSDGVLAGIY